jgi:hypothetical protein
MDQGELPAPHFAEPGDSLKIIPGGNRLDPHIFEEAFPVFCRIKDLLLPPELEPVLGDPLPALGDPADLVFTQTLGEDFGQGSPEEGVAEGARGLEAGRLTLLAAGANPEGLELGQPFGDPPFPPMGKPAPEVPGSVPFSGWRKEEPSHTSG